LHNSGLLKYQGFGGGAVSRVFPAQLLYFDIGSVGWLTSACMAGDKNTLIIVGFL
jgi:hypothetical protein